MGAQSIGCTRDQFRNKDLLRLYVSLVLFSVQTQQPHLFHLVFYNICSQDYRVHTSLLLITLFQLIVSVFQPPRIHCFVFSVSDYLYDHHPPRPHPTPVYVQFIFGFLSLRLKVIQAAITTARTHKLLNKLEAYKCNFRNGRAGQFTDI